MAAVDKEGEVVWDAKNSNLKMLVVNENRTLDYVTTPGPEGIELAFTPAVCSHNSGCLSHSSHADTFLSLCYAYHCERYPFRVYQQTLLHPCVLSTLLTPSSIVPLFLNDSHHTSGLHNPRLQVQYSFLLAFAACDWVNDTSRCSSASSSPSVEISLTYSTDTTLTLPLVPAPSSPHSQAASSIHPLSPSLYRVDLPVLCETEVLCFADQSFGLTLSINAFSFTYFLEVECLADEDIEAWEVSYENNLVGYYMSIKVALFDVMGRECRKSHDVIEVSGVSRPPRVGPSVLAPRKNLFPVVPAHRRAGQCVRVRSVISPRAALTPCRYNLFVDEKGYWYFYTSLISFLIPVTSRTISRERSTLQRPPCPLL